MIEFCGVQKDYTVKVKRKKTTITAVKDLSFQVKKGAIVGFLGENGSGKSTTIKMMCGILQPTCGSIRIDGYNPAKDRKLVIP